MSEPILDQLVNEELDKLDRENPLDENGPGYDGAEYVKCSCGDLLVLHGFGRVHLKKYLEQPYAA